jgi:hypothetical protein
VSASSKHPAGKCRSSPGLRLPNPDQVEVQKVPHHGSVSQQKGKFDVARNKLYANRTPAKVLRRVLSSTLALRSKSAGRSLLFPWWEGLARGRPRKSPDAMDVDSEYAIHQVLLAHGGLYVHSGTALLRRRRLSICLGLTQS